MSMAERIHGYFNDDGTPVNPDLMPKPGLCATYRKDDQPDQEAACHLIRMEQQGEERFVLPTNRFLGRRRLERS